MAKIGMQTGFSAPAQQNNQSNNQEWEAIDSGTYNAEVVWVKYREVHPAVMEYRENKEDNMEVVFQFKITDGEYANRRFFFDARPVINDSPKCRLRLILESILQVNSLPETFEFDTDNLAAYEGLKARIRVEKYTKEKGKNAGQEANRVTDVLAPVTNAVNLDQFTVTPPPAAPAQISHEYQYEDEDF